jgi:hypothetical protein
MSEPLARVDMVAQYIELSEDALCIQLPLSSKYVIPLKDIVDLEFKRAWFVMSGKLIVFYQENNEKQKVYMPFNFMAGRGVETLVAMMIERLANVYKNKDAIEFMQQQENIDEMMVCPYCTSRITRGITVCPGCGTPLM